MATRVVEWKKPYTWGKAIEIDENKVISLRLRDENNLIIWDEWDNEIYVDLQLDDEITPTSAFPVWITTGRVIVDNGWDLAWTIICAKTTSGDNIKLLYADEWTLWIDNWTGTFKEIYFREDVDAIILALREYIDDNINTRVFSLADNQDLDTAQEVVDWVNDWKTAIVVFYNHVYMPTAILPWTLQFETHWEVMHNYGLNEVSHVEGQSLRIFYDLQTRQVRQISYPVWEASFLDTTIDYTTPYTPQYNGSPATKKYVDDAVAWAWQVQVSSQTGNILTSWMKIWAWTESDYSSLSSYDSNTLYLTV